MKINLTNKSAQEIKQKFSFFTEENWQTEKAHFNQNLEGIYSAKKDETFIVVEDEKVHFLIGLGENPQNFEIQASAEKFTYDFRKKLKATNTEINADSFKNHQIESLVKGLFLGTYE